MANSFSSPIEGVGRQGATAPYDRLDPLKEKDSPRDERVKIPTQDRVSVSETGRVLQKAVSSSFGEVRPEIVARYKEAIQKGSLAMDGDSIAWAILVGEFY